MGNVLKIWDWSWFNWLADNVYLSQKWHFANGSYNIDCQTEPNWVKITPWITVHTTCTDAPSHILNLADYWSSWIYVFANDWKIYKDWTLIYTMVGTPNDMWGAIAQYDSWWTLYIYWMTHWYIHKATTDFVTVTENYKTIESYGSFKSPINVYWTIYLASKNIFYKLDDLGTLTTIYTFPKETIVSAMTFFQDTFNIYTNTWWNQGNQYVFVIWETSPTYNINWSWLPILWAVNLWGIDYVITGFNQFYSDLYLVSGTQRKLLKSNIEWWTGRWFYWYLFKRLDDLYISWINTTDEYIYKYWNYYPWFNQELVPFLKAPDRIISFNSNVSSLYIWCINNIVYSIELNSVPTNYNTDWEIISMLEDFWSPETKKSLQEIQLAYDNTNTWLSQRSGKFIIYARKSLTDSWTTIRDTWNKSDIWVIRIDANELISLWFWDFYQIQFKIKLQWITTSYTPFFKKLKVIYQDNLNS